MQEKYIAMVIILIILPGLIAVDPNFGSTTSEDVQFPEILDNKVIPVDANKLLANTPQAFTENRGQLENNDVRFYAQGGGIWFTDDGVWFEIREEITKNSRKSRVESQESDELFDPIARYSAPEPVEYRRVVLKQKFVGSNQVRPVGREQLNWYSNFFYGNDSSKWCTEVPNYQEIYYENLWGGIDLRYYTNENCLKYDFILYPGADAGQIRVRYEGVDGLEIDRLENLIIRTLLKNIVDGNLFIYQKSDGLVNHIKGRFEIYNKNEYGFKISEDYQKQEILVIDPEMKLEFSTYIGGNGEELCYDIGIDSAGNTIITGWTKASDFPTTPEANDTSFNGGDKDIFILKPRCAPFYHYNILSFSRTDF